MAHLLPADKSTARTPEMHPTSITSEGNAMKTAPKAALLRKAALVAGSSSRSGLSRYLSGPLASTRRYEGS